MAKAAKKVAKKSAETKTDTKKTEKKPLTKTQIVAELSESTSLAKKDVAAVIDGVCELIRKSLGNKGAGSFTLPGILKVEKKRVAAKPARKNVADPLHPGQFRDYPAKPAHNRVKIKPLKSLKEVV